MQLYDNPNVKFVIPAGGALRWNDNLAIPKKAAQIDNAHKLMNYWYDPIRGDDAVRVHRLLHAGEGRRGAGSRPTPTPRRSGSGPDTATADLYDTLAPIVVPTADQLAGTFPTSSSSEAEEAQWNDLFLAVPPLLHGRLTRPQPIAPQMPPCAA